METKTTNFNWDLYDDGFTGGSKLLQNKKIISNLKNSKCYSREPYAQELFDIYTKQNSEIIKKDLIKGDIVKIIDIFNIREDFIDIELTGGLTVTVDLNREKRFIQAFGYNTTTDFTNDLITTNIKNIFIERGITAFVIESTPNVKISLWQGHLKSVKDEFMEQIQHPTNAYKAKVIDANKGGFLVEVQGVEAFMPGSLAAPNKIIDFQSYIGKEIIVMIEDFLKDMNSFIVSHKKYLAYILPSKIQELDINIKYKGVVTGCSKYGVFCEFGTESEDNIFTGLLHISKMNDITKEQFNLRNIKPEDNIEFYISEITKDNRIILTEENPEDKLNKIQKFIVDSNDKVLESKVVAVMNFGLIVTVDEISGLIPNKEFRKHKVMSNNFMIGETINVLFDEFKDDRIIYRLPDIKSTKFIK